MAPVGLLATRYFFSRRLPSSVNILTAISMAGVLLGATALLLVLSVFNGFQGLIEEVFRSFDPDLRIVAAKGKFMPDSDSLYQVLTQQPGVVAVARTLEGRAILTYHDHQAIVEAKGVSQSYNQVSQVAGKVYLGKYLLRTPAGEPSLVLGAGVALKTSAVLDDDFNPMQLHTVANTGGVLTQRQDALRTLNATTAGIFSLQKEYDDKYALMDLQAAQELFGIADRITAYELHANPSTNFAALQARLTQQLGPDYQVLNAFTQHQTMYAVLKNEKAVGYLVLALMLLLAACTIFGSLTMVVLEKRRDIALLRAIGFRPIGISAVFMLEGLLVGGLAGGCGVALGSTLVVLQQRYGLLKISGGESFLVEAFPMRLAGGDVLLVLATVLAISLLASYYPAWQAARAPVAASLRQE